MSYAGFFWAYAGTAGNFVLVRCRTAEDAETERDRMKQSNATTVGITGRTRYPLALVRWHFGKRNWKITTVRDFRPVVEVCDGLKIQATIKAR